MGKLYKFISKGIRVKKVTVGLWNKEEQIKSRTVLQLKEKNAQKLPNTAEKLCEKDCVWDAKEQVVINLCKNKEQLKTITVRQLKEKIVTLIPDLAAELGSNNISSPPITSGRIGQIYQVILKGIRGKKVAVRLCNTEEQMKSMTVLQLKEKIAKKLPDTAGYFEKDRLQLIFTDKILDDGSSFLSEYGIQHMSVNHKVAQVLGGAGGGPLPPKGDGGMGDKEDKHHQSMERLATI